MNRRRALAGLLLAGAASAGACSFPAVAFRDEQGGGDAADATVPGDGGADGAETSFDAVGSDSAPSRCGSTEKVCGVACASKLDPNHGCGMSACDPCGGPAHGTATCPDGGQCGVLCFPPWEDCNRDAADGCEANPRAGDPDNCGACRATCAAGQFCNQGDAGCGDACAPGSTPCGSACVDEQNDPQHCGGCGAAFVCPPRDNASPVCNDGGCDYACTDPYSDCDRLPENGCEANLKANVTHCGACEGTCDAGANAAATCIDGTCQYGCLVGHADCNGDVASGGGCECAAPLVCRSGACVTCKPAGQTCQKGAECCSGSCPGVVNALGVCVGCTCQ